MNDGSTAYGYVRDIKCLLADMGGEVYVEGYERSEYNINIGGIKFNEIENCFDNSGNAFTANIPSENSLKVTEVVSQNIGDKIKKHSRIKITTTDPTPTYTGDNSAIAKKCAEQTGFVFACINIFGFMQ